ncbi:MAG: glucosyl-dolichyl phosphate glucuronosyltransferase [Blastocatellia bacterium]
MLKPPMTIDESFDISAIVCTYNRSGVLKEALARIAAQQAEGLRYEVIVVDNNSTDDTRQVIEAFVAASRRCVRYVCERQQGVSHARNAGIAASTAPLLAFFDDDVMVSSDWLIKIKQRLDLHPDVEYVGGKVLPRWATVPPAWLVPDNWAPIAALDYGDEPFVINATTQVGLISANLAIRRRALDEVGWFRPELQRVKDGIGSMEDQELLERLARAGKRGLYAPEIVVWAEVPAARMRRSYHRRWHRGHGKFYAISRSASFEQTEAGRLFDVPAHLYRQAVTDAAAWLKSTLRGRSAQAFTCQSRLWFFLGFVHERRRQYLSAQRRSNAREIADFVGLQARRLFARSGK